MCVVIVIDKAGEMDFKMRVGVRGMEHWNVTETSPPPPPVSPALIEKNNH